MRRYRIAVLCVLLLGFWTLASCNNTIPVDSGQPSGSDAVSEAVSVFESDEPIPLTAEELEYFNGDEFFNGGYPDIRNQFLSSLYDTPEEIDLFLLFYCGNGSLETFTDEENAILGVDDAPCPCEKNSRANMDAVLTEYMGLTLSDTEKIGLEHFAYLEEYDAYYHFHGDTNYRSSITFYGGERDGDIIRLFYKDDYMRGEYKAVTLREKDNGYLFISNQILKNGDSESSTENTVQPEASIGPSSNWQLRFSDYLTSEIESSVSFEKATELEAVILVGEEVITDGGIVSKFIEKLNAGEDCDLYVFSYGEMYSPHSPMFMLNIIISEMV